MPDLKEKQRKSMNKDVFAYVDKNGEGHLPLKPAEHDGKDRKWKFDEVKSLVDRLEAASAALDGTGFHASTF